MEPSATQHVGSGSVSRRSGLARGRKAERSLQPARLRKGAEGPFIRSKWALSGPPNHRAPAEVHNTQTHSIGSSDTDQPVVCYAGVCKTSRATRSKAEQTMFHTVPVWKLPLRFKESPVGFVCFIEQKAHATTRGKQDPSLARFSV